MITVAVASPDGLAALIRLGLAKGWVCCRGLRPFSWVEGTTMADGRGGAAWEEKMRRILVENRRLQAFYGGLFESVRRSGGKITRNMGG